jgi:hypothetical protein
MIKISFCNFEKSDGRFKFSRDKNIDIRLAAAGRHYIRKAIATLGRTIEELLGRLRPEILAVAQATAEARRHFKMPPE